MLYQIEAIYDQGVFRPVAPLDLPSGTRVQVRIESPPLPSTPEEEAAALEAQRKALAELFRRIREIPQTPCNDGLGGKDHDHILYGKPL